MRNLSRNSIKRFKRIAQLNGFISFKAHSNGGVYYDNNDQRFINQLINSTDGGLRVVFHLHSPGGLIGNSKRLSDL